jgi:hypothetical protein
VSHFPDALRAFIALISFGAPFYGIGIVIAAPILWFTFTRRGTTDRKDFPLLLLLPAIWLFVQIWGAWFWRYWEKHAPSNPDWVFYPVEAAPFLMLVGSLWLIWKLRGARLFVATFAVTNFYFLLVICFLVLMAMTGDWL